MLFVKDLQFLSNQADILSKLPIHELVILTKYHNDRVKIVDFFQRDSFWASPIFYYPYFTLSDQSSKNIFVTWFLTDKTSLFLKDRLNKRRIKYLQLLLIIHASFETGIGKPDHSVSPGKGRQLSDSSKVAG